jgi:hypothetical protein
MMPKMKLHIRALMGLYWVQTANPNNATVMANMTPGIYSEMFLNLSLNVTLSKISLQPSTAI